MGLRLRNPVIVAAGPWSRNGDMISKAILAGAGAVVTETIVNEVNVDVRPRIAYDGSGVQNIRLYSDILLEAWESEIRTAKTAGGVVIASICAQTPSEVAYIARKLEKAGVDAVELGLASPMGEGMEVLAASPEFVFEMTSEVVRSVDLPVMVKLSQNATNMAKVAHAAEKAGAGAISAIDTVRCILGVDIEKGAPLLPTYGGLSGAPIRPLGLASVATIAQSTRLPVCGIGGIENAHHALEYLMLGASAVQVGTAVMLHGFPVIGEILRGLEDWMAAHGIQDLAQIRGQALRGLKSFDEIKVEPKVVRLKEPCGRMECLACQSACVYEAIRGEAGQVVSDSARCKGCGLCCDVCPEKILELSW